MPMVTTVRFLRGRAAALAGVIDNFLFIESVNILAMAIIGGMGNLLGVLLGAAIIVAPAADSAPASRS